MTNNELKIYLCENNKSGYKTRENHIREQHPELYFKIINFGNGNCWHERLYNFVNNLETNPTCPECGNILHLKKYNLGYFEVCSMSCKNKSLKNKEKVVKTNMIKYGVDNPSKCQEVKNKIKDKVCKDGVWYVETDEYKEKRKRTCNERYGVDHYSKTNEYHTKVKNTSIKRYGVDSYNKTDDSINETKRNNIKKYGAEWYLSTEEFKEKSRLTNLKKRGVISHTKTDEYKEKMKKYYLNKYGVEYYTQTKEAKNKILNTMIERYGQMWIKHIPKYNPNSIIYLDMISEALNMPIQHALNGGEKKFIKYWVDGYIEKHNICIEWDEKHHNSKKQKDHDITKNEFLITNFKCKIIRINEQRFLNNVVDNTRKICEEINNYMAIMGVRIA